MRATVQQEARRMKSAAFMEPSQAELKATSVFSGSKILKTCFLVGLGIGHDLFFGKGRAGF